MRATEMLLPQEGDAPRCDMSASCGALATSRSVAFQPFNQLTAKGAACPTL